MTKTEKRRWIELVNEASSALSQLIDMQGDLQNDFEEMSETRQESEAGQLVQRLVDIDLAGLDDELTSSAQELEDSMP